MNWWMRVLQTLALPLGHVTIFGATVAAPFGAADEARTRYLHLGKVALYQMSYGRIFGAFILAPSRAILSNFGVPAKACEARFCGEEEKVWRSSQQSCLQDCTMNSRTFDEATRIGLEPTTPSVTGWCSNQLSYRAMIAQVHRFWRLTAGTCVIIPEKRAVVKHEFRKMSKKFGKVRHSGKNTKTKRTEYSLCACGRGSKSRTHGTRFWRPLLYQLSYTPTDIPHSLNA